MTTRLLTLEEILEIRRTTVPRLAELTDGVASARLHTAPDDGWSMNDVLAHLRACAAAREPTELLPMRS
jgi:hypothetical protein